MPHGPDITYAYDLASLPKWCLRIAKATMGRSCSSFALICSTLVAGENY
jgi:hypothetical protein